MKTIAKKFISDKPYKKLSSVLRILFLVIYCVQLLRICKTTLLKNFKTYIILLYF